METLLCAKCNGERNAYNLLTRMLRRDQMDYCDLCLLELERIDISYRKSGQSNSGLTLKNLQREGYRLNASV